MFPFHSTTHYRLMQSIRIRKMTCSLKDLSCVIWGKFLIIHKSTLIRFLLRSLEWKVPYQGHWCGPHCYIHCSILSPRLLVLPATSDYSMSSSWKAVFTWHLGLHSHQVSFLTLHLLSLNVGGLSSWTTFPSSCTWYFLQVLFASLMAVSASLKLAAPSWVLSSEPILDI